MQIFNSIFLFKQNKKQIFELHFFFFKMIVQSSVRNWKTSWCIFSSVNNFVRFYVEQHSWRHLVMALKILSECKRKKSFLVYSIIPRKIYFCPRDNNADEINSKLKEKKKGAAYFFSFIEGYISMWRKGSDMI